MRAFVQAISVLILSVSCASATYSSFQADVVRRVHSRQKQLRTTRAINDELLAKAIPVEEFEMKHGVSLGGTRQLGQYQMDYNDMYSFSGYSLTFAKCQPVQYFSDEAVQMGSYSAMMTDDIVVLRLCPTNSCSESKEYGCYYNYAEYAIDLQDYLGIMLRYAVQKKEYMCQYCNDCVGNQNNANRRLEDGAGQGQQQNQEADGEENRQDEQEGEQQQQDMDQNEGEAQQQAEEEGGNAEGEAAADYYDEYAANEDQGDDYYKYACGGWDSYCSEYSSVCVEDAENQNQYMDYEGYLDYLECSEVNYNDARYYIKPRCDGYHNTIKMSLHYDAYCMQASGNDLSVKNLGLGMRDSIFQSFYSGECFDCSESVSLPVAAFSSVRAPCISPNIWLNLHFLFFFPFAELSSLRCHQHHVQQNPLH